MFFLGMCQIVLLIWWSVVLRTTEKLYYVLILSSLSNSNSKITLAQEFDETKNGAKRLYLNYF